jgi:hypothetical protein
MPQLIQGVHVNDDSRRRTVGMTSVDSRRLFVLRSPSEQKIEVYETTTFKLQQILNVAGLRDNIFNDLTSCVVNNGLYVSDFRNTTIYKIELTGDNHVFKWQVDDSRKPYGLSINDACNLLVTCCDDKKLLEYTSSGSLVRGIRLEWTMSPWHAIQLTSDQFVVCTSYDDRRSYDYDDDDDDDDDDDVVEVNSRGQVVVSYKNQLQSTTRHQFDEPRHLAVDKSNECIFIAEHGNDRIVMLSRSLKCAREFNASLDGIRLRPWWGHRPQEGGGCARVL